MLLQLPSYRIVRQLKVNNIQAVSFRVKHSLSHDFYGLEPLHSKFCMAATADIEIALLLWLSCDTMLKLSLCRVCVTLQSATYLHSACYPLAVSPSHGTSSVELPSLLLLCSSASDQ